VVTERERTICGRGNRGFGGGRAEELDNRPPVRRDRSGRMPMLPKEAGERVGEGKKKEMSSHGRVGAGSIGKNQGENYN